MTKPRILIVEDERDIRRFVRMSLEREGMAVVEAVTAAQAAEEAVSRPPDLAIVDLGLPDGDGKAFIQTLRGWSASPVLVLSARDHEEEKVAALDVGADDYLVKPFGVAELLARVRAHLRRAGLVPGGNIAASVVRFGEIVVDLERRAITRTDKPVHLTRKEYQILLALIRGHGKVVTHHELLREIWGPDHQDKTHYVRLAMMNIRQKLEDNPSRPAYLMTELQVGYRLVGIEETQVVTHNIVIPK